MITYSGESFLISSDRYGESKLILNLFSKEWGLLKAIVRSSSAKGVYAGDKVEVTLRSRLSTGMPSGSVELLEGNFCSIRKNQLSLILLSMVHGLLIKLTQKEPLQQFYFETDSLVQVLKSEFDICHLIRKYLIWESCFLACMGFGLKLDSCAARDRHEGECGVLEYVSPRTGHAVCEAGGAGYEKLLLPLPNFLVGGCASGEGSVADGALLTGFFLEKRLGMDPFLKETRSKIVLACS